MKVSELEGRELDRWVAIAEGWKYHGAIGQTKAEEGKRYCLSGVNDWWDDPHGHWTCGPCSGIPYAYSTDWAHGGPIIEREKIFMVSEPWPNVVAWEAGTDFSGDESGGYNGFNIHEGPTALVAAMRAYVASKLGDSVPDDFTRGYDKAKAARAATAPAAPSRRA